MATTNFEANIGSAGLSPNSVISNTAGIQFSPNNYSNNNNNGVAITEVNSTEYLAQLIKDKNQLAAFPNVFIHLERILDEGNP
jgi:hypothetical protein